MRLFDILELDWGRMDFRSVLNYEIKKRNLTNYQISKATGISDSLISYWRKGSRKPNLDNLLLLSNYFNLSLDYLIKGEKDISILSSNHSDLSGDEKEILDNYSKLDNRGKHKIHTVIYEELDRIDTQVQKKAIGEEINE